MCLSGSWCLFGGSHTASKSKSRHCSRGPCLRQGACAERLIQVRGPAHAQAVGLARGGAGRPSGKHRGGYHFDGFSSQVDQRRRGAGGPGPLEVSGQAYRLVRPQPGQAQGWREAGEGRGRAKASTVWPVLPVHCSGWARPWAISQTNQNVFSGMSFGPCVILFAVGSLACC